MESHIPGWPGFGPPPGTRLDRESAEYHAKRHIESADRFRGGVYQYVHAHHRPAPGVPRGAAHLHFREAANSLRMSQSALSSAVSSLEETLGTQLLERTTRKVLLTPAGARVAMHATRVLRAMDDLIYGAEPEP